MNKILSFTKSIVFVLFFVLIYLIIFELATRTIISVKSKNKDIFFYGLNKNFFFEIVDLTEMKFNIINLQEQNYSETTNKNKSLDDSKKIIWTFGASQTYGYACGEGSSSWPAELENISGNLEVINFGFPSTFSDDSISKLYFHLSNNNQKPNIIIWAHREEETLAIVHGLKRNGGRIKDNFKYQSTENIALLRFEKTAMSNLISFNIFKHIFEKLKKRFNIYSIDTENSLKELDYEIALKNFELNTQDAINFSFDNGVEEFIILSLFSDIEFSQRKESLLLKNYFTVSKRLREKNDILFLDSYKYLNQSNDSVLNSFFCENKHFNLKGNKKIAEILSKNIIE